MSPEGDAAYLDGGKERGGVFGISGGDAPPAFDVKEGVLNEMSEAIEIPVIGSLVDPVSLWGDDRVDSLLSGRIKDGVGVVSPVGEKVLCAYALDKVESLSAIRCGTFRNKDSERHTMRIHGQM